jgi:hypothetical protein
MSGTAKPVVTPAGGAAVSSGPAAGAAPVATYSHFNMDGKWQVIKERSESLYTHMKALGCDEIAALASEKLDIWLNIEHSPNNPVIKIYQTSQLGTTLRVLNTTKEVAEQSVQVRACMRVDGRLSRMPHGFVSVSFLVHTILICKGPLFYLAMALLIWPTGS